MLIVNIRFSKILKGNVHVEKGFLDGRSKESRSKSNNVVNRCKIKLSTLYLLIRFENTQLLHCSVVIIVPFHMLEISDTGQLQHRKTHLQAEFQSRKIKFNFLIYLSNVLHLVFCSFYLDPVSIAEIILYLCHQVGALKTA